MELRGWEAIDMLTKQFSINRKGVYHFVSIALNIYLAAAVIMLVVYFIAPLLDGKLLPQAIVIYGSWVVMGLYLKALLKKSQKGLRIGLREHVLLCLYAIGCVFLWFPYPISFFFTVLIILGITISYKAQQRRAMTLEGNRKPMTR